VLEKINIDRSGASAAGIRDYNTETGSKIKSRQFGYLNNIVGQDHRVIKRLTRARQSFKNFWSAAITATGIEVLHMIRKGQLRLSGKREKMAEQFYSLAAYCLC
jgi:putative transposase